jgi:hypothetical protein
MIEPTNGRKNAWLQRPSFLPSQSPPLTRDKPAHNESQPQNPTPAQQHLSNHNNNKNNKSIGDATAIQGTSVSPKILFAITSLSDRLKSIETQQKNPSLASHQIDTASQSPPAFDLNMIADMQRQFMEFMQSTTLQIMNLQKTMADLAKTIATMAQSNQQSIVVTTPTMTHVNHTMIVGAASAAIGNTIASPSQVSATQHDILLPSQPDPMNND